LPGSLTSGWAGRSLYIHSHALGGTPEPPVGGPRQPHGPEGVQNAKSPPLVCPRGGTRAGVVGGALWMRTRVHLRPFRMRTPPLTNAQPRGWLLVAECSGAGPLTALNGRIATAERRRIHPWTSTGPEPHDSGHAKARECRAPYGNLGRNRLRMAIQGHPVPSARQAPASSMRATMGRKGAE